MIADRGVRWRPFLLALAVLVLWFGFLEIRGLYFPDEGRYAEIPREMLATGDWVTPRLNGIPYFEKPPLQYWATAAIFAVAGQDEWTTRLWPAFGGLAAVIAVLVTVRRLFSKRAGWMAAAVMGSCWGYFIATQFVTLDMTLSAFMTGALCAFLIAQDARQSATERRDYMLAAWALCALAVLTKGVVGAVLPILAIGVYLAVSRDVSLLRRLHVRSGALLFALIVAPWFVMAELRNPGFADFFFIHEHVMRYLRPEHHRPGPWFYFIPIALVFLMPWLPAMIAALVHRARLPRLRPSVGVDPRVFAWCSAIAIFVFFSLSSSKLPAYIMPAIGAVAIAVAAPLARRFDATLRMTAWTLGIAGLVGSALAIPAMTFVKVPMVREALAGSIGWVFVGSFMFVVAALLANALRKRRQPLRALAILAVASMIGCQMACLLLSRVDAYFSAELLIERVLVSEARRPAVAEVPFYSVDMFDQTVPFYLGRTMTLVREQSELAWGIANAPANFLPTLDDFERKWRADDTAYAIMRRETYDKFATDGLPMRLVDTDGRRVVVSRR